LLDGTKAVWQIDIEADNILRALPYGVALCPTSQCGVLGQWNGRYRNGLYGGSYAAIKVFHGVQKYTYASSKAHQISFGENKIEEAKNNLHLL
jgi:hypothetical protein